MSLANAYHSEEPRVLKWYRGSYCDSTYQAKLIKERLAGFSAEVQLSLQSQNKIATKTTSGQASLEKITRPNALAVVTGQQAGLFLGPLMTFYKAYSCILTANYLEQKYNIPVVPIFWVQSEDHDYDEIKTTTLLNHAGNLSELDLEQIENNKRSVNFIPLAEEINVLSTQLNALIERFPYAGEVLPLIHQYYQPGQSIADAFTNSLAELFAEDGLLVFNPLAATNLARVRDVYRWAQQDSLTISQQITQRNEELKKAGFEPQIHLRANSPLFFLHPHGIEQERFRIVDGKLHGTNQSISAEKIENLISSNPISVSSSALLRPIIQDSLFPTIAYVAGDAEINYFAQIEPLYRLLNLTFPLVVPRAHARIIRPWAKSHLDKLKLDLETLTKPAEQIFASITKSQSSNDSPEHLREHFANKLEQIFTEVAALFATDSLNKAFVKTRESVAHNISKLLTRYQQTYLQQDQAALQTIVRLKNELYPAEQAQERVISSLYFLALLGQVDLENSLKNSFNGIKQETTELRFS